MIPPPLVRRFQLVALALVATIAALAWLALRGPGEGGASTAPRVGNRIPFADVSPYGANFFLEREADAWTQTQTVEMAERAGIAWAKQHFLWAEIEPQRGAFDFAKYDALVDLYRDHGMEVIARLDWSPQWVRPDYEPALNNPPADLADYARFVGAVARHFRGRVRFYQIWNEPNLLSEWGNRLDHPVDPREYAAMLAQASAAAREADPDAVIVSAPLAINLEEVGVAGNLNDIDYLDGLYAAGAAPHFDILGANAFGMDRPPYDAPDPERLNFRRIELQREVMENHGDEGTAVWLNEYGWNAAPTDMDPDLLLWGRVDEVDQAAWTVDGIRWAAANWPWMGVMNTWYFRQWGGKSPDEADYYFRMVDPDFTPRRLYRSIAGAAASPAVATPGEWAERSAPVRLDRLSHWRWSRSDGALDGNAIVSAAPAAQLSLSFRGDSIAVRVKRSPDAGAIRAHVDGRRANGGANTKPLASPSDRWEWIVLADGLGEDDHELRLESVDDGAVVVDGFRVSSDPTPDASVPLLFWPLALLAALLIAILVHDGRQIAIRGRE